jgi:hypothetical protein
MNSRAAMMGRNVGHRVFAFIFLLSAVGSVLAIGSALRAEDD